MSTHFTKVGIVGAGAMGRGIAQIAIQAGCQVWLFDSDRDALQSAAAYLNYQWERQHARQRISDGMQADYQQKMHLCSEISGLVQCDLVIEAIVERLEIKIQTLRELEEIIQPGVVLVSNTSSLSITALAASLKYPQRFAGYHFFNPVPLMKLVEVVGGVRTAPQVLVHLREFAVQLGHTPVTAQDTPGFIVNHAGRGYGTEALRIASEGIADFATIDAILRDQAGFKLGPFELMDLTGLDVSHPVMESIYHQYFEEPRYRPSVITAQRLAAGMTGRKAGEGFYSYSGGQPRHAPPASAPLARSIPPVWVSARASRRLELLQMLSALGATLETGQSPSPNALIVVAPLGFDVTTVAVVERLDPAQTVGIDMLIADTQSRRRVIATNPATRMDMREAAHSLFSRDGKAVSVIRDSGGFVTQRVIAQIVNIASDICQQGICSPTDLEIAVTLGLGYPLGPLAMGNLYGPTNVLEILFNLQTVYGDPRYRPSPWLRRRGAIGLSLLHQEE